MRTAHHTPLEGRPIPVDHQGIELIERRRRRPERAEEKQIALCLSRLNGRHIEGLEQLRNKQLADPGNFVTP